MAIGIGSGADREWLVGLAPRRRTPTGDVEALGAIAMHVRGALRNAARLAEQEALARRDPLTGLLNHREFHEGLAQGLARCRRAAGAGLTVVTFDIDGFKLVNDQHGHTAGDHLLRRFAAVIDGSCRSGDTPFRIGGDEFAVLLPDTTREGAEQLACRVRAEAVALDPDIDLSYGVAGWPQDGPTKQRVLAAADAALYAMKHDRRRAGAVPRSMPRRSSNEHARERLAVASRLAARLAPLHDPAAIAALVVEELHMTFAFYLAVVQRLDDDEMLRIVAAAGPLAGTPGFLEHEQPLSVGVNGRVARTGEPALVLDTRHDEDYLGRDERTDPGSELSLPIRVAGRIWGVLNLEQIATGAFDDDDLLLADTVAAQVGAAIHRFELFAEVEQALTTTLGSLCDALDAKDGYTAAHSQDVADLAERVAVELGMGGTDLRELRYAAVLHDIGKIAVSSEILAKPGPLSDAEFREMQRHADVGGDLLARIAFFAPVAPIVRATHERWDGGGYPDGLAGEDIPLGARIVCVCDAFDAMTSDRSYRGAMPVGTALGELHRHAGSQFDRRVVDALLRVVGEQPRPARRAAVVAPRARRTPVGVPA